MSYKSNSPFAYAIFAIIQGGIGTASNLLGLGPAWAVNTQTLLQLMAILLIGRTTVFQRKHVKKMPRAATVLATVQVTAIAAIACATCAAGSLDAVHVTGSLLIGGFAVWAVRGTGRDAEEIIRTIKASPEGGAAH